MGRIFHFKTRSNLTREEVILYLISYKGLATTKLGVYELNMLLKPKLSRSNMVQYADYIHHFLTLHIHTKSYLFKLIY